MEAVEFRVLGPLEVRDGGRPLSLGGAKQRAVLAALILNANRVVPTDQLADAVWGDSRPDTATTALQVYVSRLRKVLPPGMIATQSPGYVLHVEPEHVDLIRFERLADEGRRALAGGDAEPAAERLREALGLWRGPPLAELADVGFARAELVRLGELRDVAHEDRIDADLALGRHAELVAELEALVARHPLRERLRGQLMTSLYRAGRQADALEAYRAARQTLRDELGIEPGVALQRLHTAILNQAPELDAGVGPERREGTVLFAVLGPSDEAETDPAVLDRMYAAAAAELVAAGGVVQRGLAGALLAWFEDEPQRALDAAMAARRGLAELFGESVRVRMGLELGDVLVSGTSITGAPVAAAARLAGRAAPGEILLGERAELIVG
jgi:DNA-binding SARP family transcriptional activator